MPRHRRQRVPQHRVQRPADRSGRRAQLNAALTSGPTDSVLADSVLADSVLAETGHADPDVVETTPLPVLLPHSVPLPRPADSVSYLQSADAALLPRPDDVVPGLRAHSHSKRRSGGNRAGAAIGDSAAVVEGAPVRDKAAAQGTARGLLVTPWFAAAAGFVIAAGMWIISPHAALISTSPAIGRSSQGPGAKLAGKRAGRDQNVAPGPGSSSGPATGGAGSVSQKAAAPAIVLYHGWPRDGGFLVAITLPDNQAGTHWKLTFQLPGDQHIQVWFAHWTTTSQDSGTARPQAQDPGSGQDPRQLGYPGSHRPPGVGFYVYGSGPNVKPVGCVLNGQPCQFDLQSVNHSPETGPN